MYTTEDIPDLATGPTLKGWLNCKSKSNERREEYKDGYYYIS
jgi:hypothetical protein